MNTYYTTVVVPTTTTILLIFVYVQATYQLRLRASSSIGQVEEQHADGINSKSGHHNDNDYYYYLQQGGIILLF